jgi:hypothetical protein
MRNQKLSFLVYTHTHTEITVGKSITQADRDGEVISHIPLLNEV